MPEPMTTPRRSGSTSGVLASAPRFAGGDQGVLAAWVEAANLDLGKNFRGRLLEGRRDLHRELVGLDPVERHQAHA